MKLKTLKDLPKIKSDEQNDYTLDWSLKNEAVKWVKRMDGEKEMVRTAGVFIEFFNLTEEDLK